MRKTIVGLALFAGVCSSASAVTDCRTRINKLYIGDNGTLVMELESAPPTYVAPTNQNFKLITAAALLAVNSDKTAAVRYGPDGVPCVSTGAAQTQVQGFWLINR